ncbi:hypothetical protein M3T53_03140 [Actinomyces sp. B33]|uniref:hypothetical protein n=1 Tax=Actinomyces sp. B33 TaxID=2942131 RepID=UPI0023412568|nr:hypothetical protein [Actinomyces sp. B33]MDC4232711.1 hypothetical protein [Actinomyces sp. B33]
MSSPLAPTSPVSQALAWIAALVVANAAGLVLMVPVVTAGWGLLVVTLACLRLVDSDSTALLPALRTVLARGRASALVLLAEAALLALLAWEWAVSGSLAQDAAMWAARVVIGFVAALVAVVHAWIWPMMAHRLLNGGSVAVADLPVLARAALVVGVVKLHRTAAPLIVAALPLAVASASPAWALRAGFYLLVLGAALPAYVGVVSTRPVLDPSRAEDDEGRGPDAGAAA